VHFHAVSQTNAQNSCQWLALKINKSTTSAFTSDDVSTSELPSSVAKVGDFSDDESSTDVITNVRGVVLDVYDK